MKRGGNSWPRQLPPGTHETARVGLFSGGVWVDLLAHQAGACLEAFRSLRNRNATFAVLFDAAYDIHCVVAINMSKVEGME